MRFLLPCRTRCLATIVAASCFFLVSQATAQETLRWKLQEGQQFDVVMHQEVVSEQSILGQEITTEIEMILDFVWVVDNVDDKGVISLTQTIDRMRMEMTVPGAGNIVVDTDNEEDEGPIASQVGAAIRPFIGIEIHQEMSSLGEIIEATISEEDIEALAGVGNGMFKDMFSEEVFEQMLRQAGLVFPEEALSLRDTWSSRWEIVSPFGTMSVEAQYTLVEFVEHEGVQCAKIEMSATAELNDPEMGTGDPAEINGLDIKIEIKDQEMQGVIFFAIEEGRILESQVNQTLSMEVTVGGQVIPQKISTAILMTVTPREE